MRKHWSTIRLVGIVIVAGLISCAEAVKPGAGRAASHAKSASDWILGTAVKINFQKSDSATPPGYLADEGDAFGDRENGFSYGWNVDNTDVSRDRNSAESEDPRFHTFNHLQKDDENPAVWEIELPTGEYGVHLVAGEPSHTDQISNFDLEGKLLTDPDGEDNFDEYEVSVQVSDGRLTLQPAEGAVNSKVLFIEITPR